MIAQIDSSYIRMRPWKLWSRLVSYALFEGRPLTTRGRWINSLVFAHFAIEKRLPTFKQVEKPVFILGTGRSGTTILGVVLSMHRDVGFLNEPKALWHSIYPEEDLVGNYSRSNNARYRLDTADASPAAIRFAQRILGFYLVATFSGRVVDKYPELIFRVPFVRAIFPDAKFLFLARNGWDTCHSIEKWSDRLGQQVRSETHDWWGIDRRKWNLLLNEIIPEHADLAPFAQEMRNWTNQTDMAAVEWIVSMREGLALLDKHPREVMQVRYETLCSKPQETIKEIIKFMELSDNDSQVLRYAESTLQSVATKEPFKLNKFIEEPFHKVMLELGYKRES